jgi:hypothetical protein
MWSTWSLLAVAVLVHQALVKVAALAGALAV